MTTEIDKLLSGDSLESVKFTRKQLKALRKKWMAEGAAVEREKAKAKRVSK
jgi:hypothetical protein